jgi:hypothetical protein
MQKVECYRSLDGRLHSYEEPCLEADRQYLLNAWFDRLVNSSSMYGDKKSLIIDFLLSVMSSKTSFPSQLINLMDILQDKNPYLNTKESLDE